MGEIEHVYEDTHKIDAKTVAMIRRSGRSWWQARYTDGRILSEWDTLQRKLLLLPVASSRSSRWEEVPKKDMVAIRLLCPNGMAAELQAPEGSKFFQLKAGGVSVEMQYGIGGALKNVKNERHFQNAHIIGVIKDGNGDCFCRAWETMVEVDERGKTTKTVPPGTRWLVDDTKNWPKNCLLAKNIYIHGQLRPQMRTIWGCLGNRLTIIPFPAPAWDTYLPNGAEYIITSLHKRLIQFEDNVFNMGYQNIGKLNLDVQGIKL